jgi:phage terminase large subunit-like protein
MPRARAAGPAASRQQLRSGTGSSAWSGDLGERAVRFFNNLTHTGDYAGEPFKLRPWQEAPIRQLFGTLRPDGTRQYRTTFWAFPRKQGKTEVVAGGGLYLMMGQGRPNQRIYTAAGDAKQASLIFKAACDMIRADPELEDRTVIYEGYKRIDFPAGDSSLEVLSSVPKSKHGLGPTGVLIDEMHCVEEELVNVLTTGFGARRDPLTWYITTAGWNRHSICFDEWQYAIQVRDGIVDDPTYLPVIYAADPEDDWREEATWRKAMPALGDFCSIDFIRDECRKAIERPRFENTFRQLYLNQWTEQATRWLSLEAWDACRAEIDWSRYEGRECWGGLDLSTSQDLTALVLAFPNDLGGVDLMPIFWLPGESAEERFRKDRVPYPSWVRAGHIRMTDGERLDYTVVEETLREVHSRFRLVSLAYDPAHSRLLADRLYADGNGLPMLALPNTFVNLNEPSRTFERLIVERKIRHDGNPVLRWCVSNVCLAEKGGLILPSKGKSTERIDGVAGSVMALCALGRLPEPAESVYEQRGLVLL